MSDWATGDAETTAARVATLREALTIPPRPRPALVRLVRTPLRVILWLGLRTGFRLRTEGRRREGPAVIVSNHPHVVDGLVVLVVDPRMRPVARWHRVPLLRSGMWVADCIITTAECHPPRPHRPGPVGGAHPGETPPVAAEDPAGPHPAQPRPPGPRAHARGPDRLLHPLRRVGAKGEGRFVRQTGGRGQVGHCLVEIEPPPAEEGQKLEIVNRVVGGRIAEEVIGPGGQGSRAGTETGPLAGHQEPRHQALVATLVDGVNGAQPADARVVGHLQFQPLHVHHPG